MQEKKREEMEIMKSSLEKEVKRQDELLQQNIRYMTEIERMEVGGRGHKLKNKEKTWEKEENKKWGLKKKMMI